MKHDNINFIFETIEHQKKLIKRYELIQSELEKVISDINSGHNSSILILEKVKVIVTLLSHHTKDNITWSQENIEKLKELSNDGEPITKDKNVH